MRIFKFLFLFSVTMLLFSCSSSRWVVTSVQGSRIPLDISAEKTADEKMTAMIQPYKELLDAEMNEVIGYAPQAMRAHGPESLLSNFSADIYRLAATNKLNQPVDIAIVNRGGLRTQITAGNVTVGKVFELMPFENELVVLWLRGSELEALLHFFASVNGEGVSGLRMGISNGKAVNITIGGEELKPDKLYSIATNDYLAEGNDGMKQLKLAEKKESTGIKVRDMLMSHIRSLTAAGENVTSVLDGRVSVMP
jgi:2',3'-cyclic-nucleotide 2'-phosphodiesterase (5'-nucleotidase family)